MKPKQGIPVADEQQTNAIVQAETTAAGEMLKQFQQIEIDGQDDFGAVGELLTEIKRRSKALETARKEITAPMLDAKKKVDDLFRTPLDLLTRCEGVLKAKVQAYMRQREAEVLKQISDPAAADAAALVPAAAMATLPTNMSERRVWTFEVVDASLVPRDFLLVDSEKVREAIKALGGENVVIPGIRIFQEKQLSVRTGGGV